MGFSFAGANKAINDIRAEAKADKKARDELISKRENTLLQLGLTKKQTQSTANDKALRDAALGTRRLEARIKELDLEGNEELEKYYETLLSDPLAANDVVKFIDEQETKYDTVVDLNLLPSLIKIIPNDQIPLQEKMDYVGMIINADLTNKEEYFRLAQQINDMVSGKPGRKVFTDIVPGQRTDIVRTAKTEDAQEEGLQAYVATRAFNFITRNNSDSSNPQVRKTQQLLNQLKTTGETNAASRRLALGELVQLYMTPEDIYDLTQNNPDFYRGFMESSFVTSYLDIFNYPPIDTTDTDTQKLIEILKANPTTDNKYKFDLRFGKGAHEAYI
jgi:hypothetical protein|tara:strand:- start:3611 stop:4606 length:996 start_codon:yes stop_codon:yes gene_type:complete